MAEKKDEGDTQGVSFNITLQPDIIEIIEKDVAAAKLWGKRRATICSNLIVDMLKRLGADGVIKLSKPGD
jgi:hypothetical protein